MKAYLLLMATTAICPADPSNPAHCMLPHQSPANGGDLQAILQILLGIIGAFALLIITISGMRYITSGGNPEKTAKAKNSLVYALVGLVVAISAEAIVTFVVKRL